MTIQNMQLNNENMWLSAHSKYLEIIIIDNYLIFNKQMIRRERIGFMIDVNSEMKEVKNVLIFNWPELVLRGVLEN